MLKAGFCCVVAILLPLAVMGQSEKPLTVEVHSSEFEEPQEPFTIRVVFTNRSREALQVSNVRLELPHALVVKPRQALMQLSDPSFTVFQGSSHEIQVGVPGVTLRQAPGMILFSHGTYPAKVFYDYGSVSLSGPAQPQAGDAAIDLTLDGPRWAVVFGAAVGLPFFLFFRYGLRKLRGIPLAPNASPFWLSCVVSLMVVALSAFLFRFTSMEMPKLPVAVQVKDFWGGVLLNLVLTQLTTWFTSIVLPN